MAPLGFADVAAPSHVTALTITGFPGQVVSLSLVINAGLGIDFVAYGVYLRDDGTIAQSFPVPIGGVQTIRIACVAADDATCDLRDTVAGY